MYIPFDSSFMPLHPDMFGIRPTSVEETWTNKGIGFGYLANIEMQPLGRQRI